MGHVLFCRWQSKGWRSGTSLTGFRPPDCGLSSAGGLMPFRSTARGFACGEPSAELDLVSGKILFDVRQRERGSRPAASGKRTLTCAASVMLSLVTFSAPHHHHPPPQLVVSSNCSQVPDFLTWFASGRVRQGVRRRASEG